MLFSSHSLSKHAGKYWWTIMLDLAAPLRSASDKHKQAFLSEKKKHHDDHYEKVLQFYKTSL